MFFICSLTSAFVSTYYFTKRFYPSTIDHLQILTAWYSLKTYCFFEGLITKITLPFRLIFRKNVFSSEPKCIVFINSEGKEIVRHSETEFKKLCLANTLKKDMDYAFIIYEFSSLNEGEEKNDKYEKYMLFFDEHTNVTNNFKINSNMKLLGITVKIKIEEEYYKVSMNFGKDNYYIVGNKILSRSFLNWFLKNTLVGAENVPYITEKTNYFVSFIDQKMKCIELKENQYLQINAEDYNICEEVIMQ